MTLSPLSEAARHASPDTALDYRMEYHKRLIIPVGSFLLCLLGLPLGLLARPGSRAIGLPFGLFLFLSYYLGFSAARATTESMVGTHPGMALWMINIIFLILTSILLSMTFSEKLDRVTDFMDNIFYVLASWKNKMRKRHASA